MKYYAVIDTNVIIAALLTKNSDAATLKVLHAVLDGSITPLYHEDILSEYDEVLHRRKFHLQEGTIQLVLTAIKQYGLEVQPQPTGEILLDMDDLIFYEVAMEKRGAGAWLVAGNQKHYPVRSFIVTPAEMMKILESGGNETLYLNSIPGMAESIIEAKNEPVEEAAVSEEGEEW